VARNKDLTAPTFDSTIISNNGALYDLDCGGNCVIAGSNNLIRTWNDGATVRPTRSHRIRTWRRSGLTAALRPARRAIR
jgi:hypothetical protein